MRVRFLLPVLLAVAAAATACATHETKPVAPPAAPSAAPAPSLVGSAWLLEDLGGKDVIDSIAATLSFPEPGQAAGSGSCNPFSGTVTISGNTIAFGPLAATRKSCVPNVNEQEAAYLKALQDAERFEVDDMFLSIYYKGGTKPLKFIRSSHP